MNLVYSMVGLAGTIALMLWGIRMVQTGVQRAFGARLRGFLATTLDNRLKAFLAGMGVTTVLQSSTATALMVTGFATGSLIGLVPALAVMLGANVGTTVAVPTPDEFAAHIVDLETLIADLKAESEAAEAARPQMKPKR